MASYKVVITTAARRELRKLPKAVIPRIVERLRSLETDPYNAQAEKLTTIDGWRVRVGDYRIVYEIDSGKREVTVSRIRHRREVYRNL